MKKIELSEIKKLEVEMLKIIDKICRENNIKYFAIGGTLIGAIRHDGFIPWDDDIDIGLTADNYSKLIELLEKYCDNNNVHYKILEDNKCGSYYYPFAKMVNTNTIVYEGMVGDENMGVFVDIFCFNPLPNNEKVAHKTYRKMKFIKDYGIKIINSNNDRTTKNYKKPFRKIVRFIEKNIIGQKRILNEYKKCYKKYSNCEPKYGISNWLTYNEKNELYEWNDFQEVINHKFENLEIMIPKEYDSVLRNCYGDYMKLPPEEDRIPQHTAEAYYRDKK